MSGKAGGGKAGGGGRQGGGGVSKSGRPRPGTGGYGRAKLEGKGPTPPAEMRPGHPAQRRAAAAAAASARSKTGRDAGSAGRAGAGAARGAGSRAGRDAGTGREAGPGGRLSAGASRQRDSSRANFSSESGVYGRTPAGRNARGAGNVAEIVAGRNPVLESLRADVPATALHVGPRLDADERITEAVKLAADRGIPVVEAGRSELDRFTGGAIHQGLALRIRPYSYAHADDLIADAELPLVVALDGVTDPRNLGAVVRSVAAFGGDGVLVPARRSAGVTAGAWKASAGALARVRVAQASNLSSALAGYAKAGLFIVGLDADSDTDIGSLDLATGPLVLVIGSEGKGLSRLVSQHCDQIARIPITGAESLNASVAAGIALYQVTQLRAGADD
ncbi:MAG TPA: 23S rRNA (guanosine(2251)-2'-O)-methyltransferase RlmB [Streptosporangiaceae bacterium]|nr:23S rRNA (guanosine(2251)-2'-O)-methyltransferase RlmB [Streptosporangiaceae bacterium]